MGTKSRNKTTSANEAESTDELEGSTSNQQSGEQEPGEAAPSVTEEHGPSVETAEQPPVTETPNDPSSVNEEPIAAESPAAQPEGVDAAPLTVERTTNHSEPPMPASVQAAAEAASQPPVDGPSDEQPRDDEPAAEQLPEEPAITAIDQAAMEAAAETALPAGILLAAPAPPVEDDERDWPQTGHITNESPFPIIEPETGVVLIPFVKTPITVPDADAAQRLVGALITLARTKGIDEDKLKFSTT